VPLLMLMYAGLSGLRWLASAVALERKPACPGQWAHLSASDESVVRKPTIKPEKGAAKCRHNFATFHRRYGTAIVRANGNAHAHVAPGPPPLGHLTSPYTHIATLMRVLLA
jgi:hypothetical protein